MVQIPYLFLKEMNTEYSLCFSIFILQYAHVASVKCHEGEKDGTWAYYRNIGYYIYRTINCRSLK